MLSLGLGIVSNGHLRLLKASGEMSSVLGRYQICQSLDRFFPFTSLGVEVIFEGEACSNVMVRSPCLSVVLVLEFSDRGISQIGSRPDVSIRKSSQCGNRVSVSKRKGGRRVLGVGIGHVRCHVTCRRVKVNHVIRHVTYLRVSEDYTSRRDLESSKIQHLISKMFRDEKRIATKSTIAKGGSF